MGCSTEVGSAAPQKRRKFSVVFFYVKQPERLPKKLFREEEKQDVRRSRFLKRRAKRLCFDEVTRLRLRRTIAVSSLRSLQIRSAAPRKRRANRSSFSMLFVNERVVIVETFLLARRGLLSKVLTEKSVML